MQEIHDYILNIGVKNNSSRSELMADFQILFNEKTEQLVKWLFECLAPTIRLEAAKLERESKPAKGGGSPGGVDLLQEFVDAADDSQDQRQSQRGGLVNRRFDRRGDGQMGGGYQRDQNGKKPYQKRLLDPAQSG